MVMVTVLKLRKLLFLIAQLLDNQKLLGIFVLMGGRK